MSFLNKTCIFCGDRFHYDWGCCGYVEYHEDGYCSENCKILHTDPYGMIRIFVQDLTPEQTVMSEKIVNNPILAESLSGKIKEYLENL